VTLERSLLRPPPGSSLVAGAELRPPLGKTEMCRVTLEGCLPRWRCVVELVGKALFLGKATACGSNGSGYDGWPRTADASAFPAACNLDANGGEVGVDVPGACGKIVVAPGLGIVRFGMRAASLEDVVSFLEENERYAGEVARNRTVGEVVWSHGMGESWYPKG